MAYQRKRIAILFCGGTTIDERDRPGDSVKKPGDIERWMEQMDEVQLIGQADPFFVYGGEGAAISAKEWTDLAKTIEREYSRYHGFFILHSLDTLAYSAVALSFMLQNLEKPVVLTGSPIPTREEQRASLGEFPVRRFKGLGVKANLMNALQVAVSEVAEVCVVFGSRIFRGSQVIKNPPGHPNPFDTYDGQVLGKIDFGTQFFSDIVRRRKRTFKASPKVDDQIVQFDFRPGVDPALLEQFISQKTHGILLTTTATTALPEVFRKTLLKGQTQGIPIAVYSPRPVKPVRGSPFLVIGGMSPLAALVKFMWVRGQTADRSKLQALLAKDIARETVSEVPKLETAQ